LIAHCNSLSNLKVGAKKKSTIAGHSETLHKQPLAINVRGFLLPILLLPLTKSGLRLFYAILLILTFISGYGELFWFLITQPRKPLFLANLDERNFLHRTE
jgi:hypothetical protein